MVAEWILMAENAFSWMGWFTGCCTIDFPWELAGCPHAMSRIKIITGKKVISHFFCVFHPVGLLTNVMQLFRENHFSLVAILGNFPTPRYFCLSDLLIKPYFQAEVELLKKNEALEIHS